MNADRFKDREHLFRLGGLSIAGVLVFLVVQALLVPKGFGVYGHFRAGALDDNRARKISFAGRTTCEACHSDVVGAQGGKHAGIGCEACHSHSPATPRRTRLPETRAPDARCARSATRPTWRNRGLPRWTPEPRRAALPHLPSGAPARRRPEAKP
jgi:hypothetical protein